MGEQRTITALTGVRALAAVWVVLNHFEKALLALFPGLRVVEPLLGHGWLGVEVFFVLSGFIIAHNYARRLAQHETSDVRAFWWARVARIYPVHLATLAAMLGLLVAAKLTGTALNTADNYTVGNVTANILLAQAVPGFHGINWPSWSVSCEAAAYLVFPLLAGGLMRLSGRAALRAAAAVLVVGVVGMQLDGLASGTWAQLDYSVMWLRIAVEFAAGALLWVWWSRRGRLGYGGDAAAVGSVVATVVGVSLTGRDAPAAFVVLPFLALFVVAVACARGPVARLLSSAPLQWGGRVSYSLYMVHSLVFLVAEKLVGWDRFAGSALSTRLAVAGAIGGLILLAACAAYYLVEEPGRRLVRSWTSTEGVRPPAVDPSGASG